MLIIHKNYIYEAINLENPINGGIGDNTSPNAKELEKGIEVEKEHVGNLNEPEKIAFAADIARDHIAEHPKYYDELEKMEKKLEREEKT